MKKTNLIILLIFTNLIYPQTKLYKGIIKDATTLLPIDYAHINFNSTNEINSNGSISNELGEFSFNHNNPEVTFSHVNFESLTINIQENENEILLQPKKFILDEVILSKTPTQEYLKNIIKNSKSKIDKNILLKSYCREIVKVNSKNNNFSDAMVDFYVKKNNGKSITVLYQSRALKKSNVEVEENSKVIDLNLGFNIKDYVKNAYNFISIENILKDKEYEFLRKLKKESNGNEYEYIEIIPKFGSERMLSKGYVIIDINTKTILEIKIYTSEDHLKNAKQINLTNTKTKLNNFLTWSKFNLKDNNYVLAYHKFQMSIYFKMGESIGHNYDFSSVFFVYDYKKNIEIPENGYNYKTIYEGGTKYTENYWEKYNAFPLTEEQMKFIKNAKEIPGKKED
jgi:hypothetical protein